MDTKAIPINPDLRTVGVLPLRSVFARESFAARLLTHSPKQFLAYFTRNAPQASHAFFSVDLRAYDPLTGFGGLNGCRNSGIRKGRKQAGLGPGEKEHMGINQSLKYLRSCSAQELLCVLGKKQQRKGIQQIWNQRRHCGGCASDEVLLRLVNKTW